MPYNFIFQTIRTFFAFFDFLVYSLYTMITWFFFDLLLDNFMDENVILQLISRFYIIIGIFVLFKMSFLILTSIIDPDKFSDKQSGLQNIIKRVIICISLFSLMPNIFKIAFEVQGDIVAVIPRIIIGQGSDDTDDSPLDMAVNMAMTTWGAFVTPNKKCNDGDSYDNSSLIGMFGTINEKCDKIDISMTTDKQFKYDYVFGISYICGMIMVFVMLFYCFDVGIRMFKMVFLMILSPIAIFSYIDPRLDKQGMFTSWIKSCLKVYCDIFIKVATVYFALALVSLFINNLVYPVVPDGANFVMAPNGFKAIVYIVGVLIFLLTSRKFINESLNLKTEAGFIGNLAKGLAIGAGGAALGVLGAGAAAGMAANGGGILAGMRKSSAALRNAMLQGGAKGLFAGKGAKFGDSLSSGMDVFAQYETGNPSAKHKTFSEKASNRATLDALMSKLGVGSHDDIEKVIDNEEKDILKQRNVGSEMQRNLNNMQQMSSISSNISANNSLLNTTGTEINSIRSKLGNRKLPRSVKDSLNQQLQALSTKEFELKAQNSQLESQMRSLRSSTNIDTTNFSDADYERVIKEISNDINEHQMNLAKKEARYNEINDIYKKASSEHNGKEINGFKRM